MRPPNIVLHYTVILTIYQEKRTSVKAYFTGYVSEINTFSIADNVYFIINICGGILVFYKILIIPLNREFR